MGDGPAAVDALSAAVRGEPGRGELWSQLATALVAAERASEAWNAAVRAVELAPRSAASHRAIGTVAAALGDSAQAETAFRHAQLLDPAGAPTPDSGGGRHASDRADALATWTANQIATPDAGNGRRAPGTDTPAAQPHGSRHAARPSGARGPGGRARAAPAGATRVIDPESWHRGLITVVRIEWLVGVVCFLGLAYARTAPYTAGLLAGALVVAGAYGRRRWRSIATRRPPEPDRIPTYAAVAAVAIAVVIIPAAMAGGLTLARLAAVAAVTSATVAAVLLARTRG